MDTQAAHDAVTYLNSVGPRSNLGKIRRSLEALDGTVPAAERDAALAALGEADWTCATDSGEEPDARADARETLEGAIADLLYAIEDAEQETPAVTAGDTSDETPAVTDAAAAAVAAEDDRIPLGRLWVRVTPGGGRDYELSDFPGDERTKSELKVWWTVLDAAAREIAREVTPAVTKRMCACGCGQPVTSPRPEALYATGACRVRAHRRQ